MVIRRELASAANRGNVVALLAGFVLACASSGPTKGTSAYSTESDESTYGFPAAEIFGAPCLMPNVEMQRPPSSSVSPSAPGDELSDIQPIRSIVDPYPSFNGIAFDPANDFVVMSDTNKKSLLTYDRSKETIRQERPRRCARSSDLLQTSGSSRELQSIQRTEKSSQSTMILKIDSWCSRPRMREA